MKIIHMYVLLVLFLCIPSQLHLAECKIDAQNKQIAGAEQAQILAECFKSITLPGTLACDSGEAVTISSHTHDNQTDRNGIPFNILTITSLDTDEILLEFAGYIKPVYVARREAVCWCLDHADGTITYIPLEPITSNDVRALDNEQRKLIQTIVQRHTPDAFVMSEEQTKLFSSLPRWYQRVLSLRYGVNSTYVVHS